MAKFELNMGEEKLMESFGSFAPEGKSFGAAGSIWVTNQRVIYLVHSPLIMAFGLLGMLLIPKLTPPKFREDIPLDTVNGYTVAKLGLGRRVYRLELGNGETKTVSVDKYNQFATALRGALERMGRVGTDTPDGGWKVR